MLGLSVILVAINSLNTIFYRHMKHMMEVMNMSKAILKGNITDKIKYYHKMQLYCTILYHQTVVIILTPQSFDNYFKEEPGCVDKVDGCTGRRLVLGFLQ